LLVVFILGAAGALGWFMWRRRTRFAPSVRGLRAVALWALQSCLIALLLLLLWEPAISVTILKPQQNVVAVLIDDSRSMSLRDTGDSREDQALKLLNSGLLRDLSKRF